jgi:uncharacterized coiled-coil DUF342 family protein
MGIVNFKILNGPAADEMHLSQQQLKNINEGCIKASLRKLTPEQKTQLLESISKLRSQITAAYDAIQSRRAKTEAQVIRLLEKASAVANTAQTFNSFYRQMTPAITACEEASAATDNIHSAIQPVVRQSNELQYKILLAKSKSALLTEQLEDIKKALNYLDKVSVSIS